MGLVIAMLPGYCLPRWILSFPVDVPERSWSWVGSRVPQSTKVAEQPYRLEDLSQSFLSILAHCDGSSRTICRRHDSRLEQVYPMARPISCLHWPNLEIVLGI